MIKPIAIYLPQYHTIPENDIAWGEGFTEWTNVKKAVPLFDGHYQPHIPDETLGYYDLSDSEILIKQAALAKEYGIFGFAYYHYWFNGKRLLESPLDKMLASGKPDFPFCYIWANENWTKRWDGADHEIIQEQHYSQKDDLNHIRFLCQNIFSDKRYISIDEKPVFLVYRTELLPDIEKTAHLWREEAKKLGFKDLYLIRVESFVSGVNPYDIGFDASLEFAPDFRNPGLNKTTKNLTDNKDILVFDYQSAVAEMLIKENSNFPKFRTVFPSWDNTPRKKNGGLVFSNSSPEVFGLFVSKIIEFTRKTHREDHQYFFINAWNEWGEGCHIEPDQKYGNLFLHELKSALNNPENEHNTAYILFLEKTLNQYIEKHKLLIDAIKKENNIANSTTYKLTHYILKRILFLKKGYRLKKLSQNH